MAEFEFFLGGRDLEMVTIHQILIESGIALVHDHSLNWGARTSAYRDEIQASVDAGRVPVLIELNDDLGFGRQAAEQNVVVIDHHGDRAGRDSKTSLEQVFELLKLPQEKWTRRLDLISANDRGHVVAMQRLGATRDEMLEIRAKDRQAQGITADEEESGRRAVDARKSYRSGTLTVVSLPHARTAVVTDLLSAELDGPGYRNLAIFSPNETFFFGTGRVIQHLNAWFPDSWYGGELPEQGYWGCSRNIIPQTFIEQVEIAMSKPATEIPVLAFHHKLI